MYISSDAGSENGALSVPADWYTPRLDGKINPGLHFTIERELQNTGGGALRAAGRSSQRTASLQIHDPAAYIPSHPSGTSQHPRPAADNLKIPRETAADAIHPALDIERKPWFKWKIVLPDGEEQWSPNLEGAPNSRDMLPGDVELIGGGPWITVQECARALEAKTSIRKKEDGKEDTDKDERASSVAPSEPGGHIKQNTPPWHTSPQITEEQWAPAQHAALALPPYGGGTPDDGASHNVASSRASKRQARDSEPQYCVFCGKSQVGRGGHHMKRHWDGCRAFERLAANEVLGPWVSDNLRAFRRKDLCQIYGGGPGSPGLTSDGSFQVRNTKFSQSPVKRNGMLGPFTPPQSAVRR
ncbi:hypothetical protein AURDEDRAFT_165400 [Auricularia subglabra TFB-10046 SS5]|nr:hypothetical protein AURDEDRAFT_165400 [Auricularia subglabra TFB-10046 SS5]